MKTDTATLDSCQLCDVSGGVPTKALLEPGNAEAVGDLAEVLGTPIRALGRYAPFTASALALGAKMRHELYNAVVHRGNPRANQVHNMWIKKMYGPYAR